ncbi:interferon-induced GTP-binding protein Mx2 [Coccidioides immitis RMSCC 3703]|uniref:Interferon-induced GTP-binding protein Mx2 n=1 Tax=Coccidioides immitis RMSCC 3703 TaxID=454286 RepID=A0A0J8QPL3_COCIT|nr:interferon-induced GTP-binding protein Mx2 [Coccidioides immitis RMSCC 3703]
MGLSTPGAGKVFSTDVLRVELSGPQQPHLTMVDLSGLFEAGNRDQSKEDARMVKSLILSYMESPRSIILAVVSAKSDFALQSVTKHARRLDPAGIRTLGLITKPDTLDQGSDSERAYLELAQNKDVKFRLGWHVLHNRDFSMRYASTAEQDQTESEFFSKGVWTSLNPIHAGITALRPRLSHILLEKLGASRATLQEQHQYLLQAAVAGMYDGPFFGSAHTDEGYKKCLRAVVQNTLLSFADKMKERGHSVRIVEEAKDDDSLPKEVSRATYAEKVKRLMVRSRSCNILNTSYFMVNSALDYTTDEETAGALQHEIILPRLYELRKSLQRKVVEILEPHKSGHPITYNHYLMENVQKAQAARRKRQLEKVLKSFFGTQSADDILYTVNVNNLLSQLVESTEADMDCYAAYAATDMMEVYYKKVVDDISILAIEKCLIEQLPTLFTPETVFALTDDITKRITSESEELVTEWTCSTERLQVLETGQENLSFGSDSSSPTNGGGMGWPDLSEVLSPAEELPEAPATEPMPDTEPEHTPETEPEPEPEEPRPEELADDAQPFELPSLCSSTKGKKKKKNKMFTLVSRRNPFTLGTTAELRIKNDGVDCFDAAQHLCAVGNIASPGKCWRADAALVEGA